MDKTRYDLALDMDETMCSFVGGIIDKMRPLMPDAQFKLPGYGKYNHFFPTYFAGEKRALLEEHIFKDEFYLGLTPILSGHDGHTIEKLSRVCWENFDRIKVVTYRHGYCQNPKEVTQEWLKLNGFVDSERVQVNVLKMDESKVDYLTRSTVVVDDSISVADAVTASRNHQMILVSHPWNDGYARSANCAITPVRRLIERIASVRADL